MIPTEKRPKHRGKGFRMVLANRARCDGGPSGLCDNTCPRHWPEGYAAKRATHKAGLDPVPAPSRVDMWDRK